MSPIDDHHGAFRGDTSDRGTPAPPRRRRVERLDRADRLAIGDRLAGEHQVEHRILQPHLRPGCSRCSASTTGRSALSACWVIAGADIMPARILKLSSSPVGSRSADRACRWSGEGGARVRIRAEGHAQPLPDPLRFAVRHIGRSAEGEMLEKMGEAALAVLLVQRARIDPHAHRDLARRHAVLAHRIAQAVRQPPELPLHRHGRGRCPCRARDRPAVWTGRGAVCAVCLPAGRAGESVTRAREARSGDRRVEAWIPSNGELPRLPPDLSAYAPRSSYGFGMR
jgi:hypothetical protein